MSRREGSIHLVLDGPAALGFPKVILQTVVRCRMQQLALRFAEILLLSLSRHKFILSHPDKQIHVHGALLTPARALGPMVWLSVTGLRIAPSREPLPLLFT
jgi:hypothetical protein